jgi:hypothetical protein
MFQNGVRTSQETHYVSATEPNRLMMLRETVAVYCENRTKHVDCVGIMQSFSVLQRVVRIVTTEL